jgi:hypothetical protein
MNKQLNLKYTAHGAGIKKKPADLHATHHLPLDSFFQSLAETRTKAKNIYDRYTIPRSLMVYGLRILDAWEADRS